MCVGAKADNLSASSAFDLNNEQTAVKLVKVPGRRKSNALGASVETVGYSKACTRTEAGAMQP